MADKTTTVIQTGVNGYRTAAKAFNKVATDTLYPGVVGAFTNTSGVAPANGSMAANAQGSPNMTVAISAGTTYVLATPASGVAQMVAVELLASEDVAIASNATGSTRYDFVYVKVDAGKMNNPAVDGLDVATLITQRSSTQTVDSNGVPANATLIAEVTVANGASSIANASIADRRLPINDRTDGWQQCNESHVYSSVTGIIGVVTVPSGALFKYSVGDKYKYIQSGVQKFAYITAVTDTTISINGGSDYVLANAAIGSPCYSKRVSPVGFPQWFNFTPTYANLTVGAGANEGRFSMVSKVVHMYVEWVFGAGAAVGSNPAIIPPVAVSSNYRTSGTLSTVGHSLVLDSGTANFTGGVSVNSSGNIQPFTHNAGSAYATANYHNSTTPMTWTTADELRAEATYEAA